MEQGAKSIFLGVFWDMAVTDPERIQVMVIAAFDNAISFTVVRGSGLIPESERPPFNESGLVIHQEAEVELPVAHYGKAFVEPAQIIVDRAPEEKRDADLL